MKSGLPFHLAELHRVLPTAHQSVDGLDAHSPSGAFDKAADQMWRAVLITREIAGTTSRTECSTHPDGPIDHDPPEGWTRCLLCNTKRKRGLRDQGIRIHSGPSRNASNAGVVSIDIGDRLRELRAWMETINDLAFELRLESPVDDLKTLAEATHGAFVILRELSRPVSLTGCAEHPEGARDFDPPAGWGSCLHCNTRRRRELLRARPTDRPRLELWSDRAEPPRSVQRGIQRARQEQASPGSGPGAVPRPGGRPSPGA